MCTSIDWRCVTLSIRTNSISNEKEQWSLKLAWFGSLFYSKIGRNLLLLKYSKLFFKDHSALFSFWSNTRFKLVLNGIYNKHSNSFVSCPLFKKFWFPCSASRRRPTPGSTRTTQKSYPMSDRAVQTLLELQQGWCHAHCPEELFPSAWPPSQGRTFSSVTLSCCNFMPFPILLLLVVWASSPKPPANI